MSKEDIARFVNERTLYCGVVTSYVFYCGACTFNARDENRQLLYLASGTRWRNWSRHCVTSRKVAGSIPDGVVGIIH